MNDRFKFRVWLPFEKRMITTDNESFFTLNQHGSLLKINDKNEVFFARIGHTFSKENIMQCTGKKDCTGKLIYEEDIVTLTGTNGMVCTYVVKFKDYAFVLEYLDGKRARYFHKQYAQPKCLYKEGYRVIGNTYQNPDLLK